MSWRWQRIWLHWQQTVAETDSPVRGCCSQASGFYSLARSYYHSFVGTLLGYENSNQSLLSVPLDPNQGEPMLAHSCWFKCMRVANDRNWSERKTPVGSWSNQLWLYLNQESSLKKNNSKQTVTDLAKVGNKKNVLPSCRIQTHFNKIDRYFRFLKSLKLPVFPVSNPFHSMRRR